MKIADMSDDELLAELERAERLLDALGGPSDDPHGSAEFDVEKVFRPGKAPSPGRLLISCIVAPDGSEWLTIGRDIDMLPTFTVSADRLGDFAEALQAALDRARADARERADA